MLLFCFDSVVTLEQTALCRNAPETEWDESPTPRERGEPPSLGENGGSASSITQGVPAL